MSPSQPNNIVKIVTTVLAIGVVSLAAYNIYNDFKINSETGLLQVSSNDSKSTLSITQPFHQGSVLGSGQAKVRLSPGTYQVTASNNGYQTSEKVVVRKLQTTSSNLTLPRGSQNSYASNLFADLPFQSATYQFNITYQQIITDKSTEPVLIITAPNQAAHQKALDWITAAGFNPSNYTIQYINQQIINYNYTGGIPGVKL